MKILRFIIFLIIVVIVSLPNFSVANSRYTSLILAQSGTTERVSVASDGSQGDGPSFGDSISEDGRFVAFYSLSSNLISGDTNGLWDVFIHDRQSNVTERVSVASDGTQGNLQSSNPSISPDGRFVAFRSFANNLVDRDTNGFYDIFVHDRQTGITERVSVASDGSQGNENSDHPSISRDGQFVVFESNASNLVISDVSYRNIFIHDRLSGETRLVSVKSDGTQGNRDSFDPLISADGRFVIYSSNSTNLVNGDTNGTYDIFMYDRQTGVTERVSIDSDGMEGNSSSISPFISSDGRFVTFLSYASNLVSGDTNGTYDSFVHDRQTKVTERVSVASDGTQGNLSSSVTIISADGRFVIFRSYASNLAIGDTNENADIFIHDRLINVTERISVASDGTQGDSASDDPWVSSDGRIVAFESSSHNLVNGDSNGYSDIFLHDRCPDGSCVFSYSLSGRIVDSQGTGMPDVKISVKGLDGLVRSVGISSSTGEYHLVGLNTGKYRIYVTKTNYGFFPEALSVVMDGDKSGQDFNGTLLKCPTTEPCIIPSTEPFLDLPFFYTDFGSAEIGAGGLVKEARVMSWYDHHQPNEIGDGKTVIWDGYERPGNAILGCK